MSTHGGGAARAKQAAGGRDAGPRAPFTPRLPSASELERLGDEDGGLYRGVAEDAARPTEDQMVQHYADVLGGNRQVQAALDAVAEHWDAAGTGYSLRDPQAFGEDLHGQAARSMHGIFRTYDTITAGRAALPLATALQEAARVEFGLQRTANTATPEERALADRLFGTVQPGLRIILRQMYEETQAWLREHGVREVVLARGTRFAPGQEPKGINWNGRVEPRQVASKPLASWATNLYTASAFAHPWGDAESRSGVYGLTSAATVPASRIFSTEFTGILRSGEAEVIVLGGTDVAQTKAAYIAPTDGYRQSFTYGQVLREFGGAGS